MTRFFVFLLLSSALFASDHCISQTHRERHTKMREYYKQTPQPQESCSWWNGDYMTEGWGQFRHDMATHGVTVDSSFTTNMQGNPAGGKARGFAYVGSYGLSVTIDLTHTGWDGFQLYAAACWRTGTNLSSRKIDNQFTVSQLFGSQTVKLVELYALQSFWNDRFIMKAGRLCAGDDFLASPIYGQFVNNAFDGNPVSIFYNIPFTAYPGATWGAYVEGKPWDWLSAKFAVFNANGDIGKDKYHGTNFTFSSTNGVVLITEWCLLVNQGKNSHGMPGNYKAGFYYLTGDALQKNHFSGGKHHGDPGFYLLFDQMVYREGGKGSDIGLTPFISLIFQPKSYNEFPFFANGGVLYKGLFPGRPKDTAALGFVYGKYSSDLAAEERAKGQKPQNAETVLELSYWCQINKWFYIMPDMQYIIRPKGTNTYPNAWVIGAQIGLDQW